MAAPTSASASGEEPPKIEREDLQDILLDLKERILELENIDLKPHLAQAFRIQVVSLPAALVC